MAATAGLDLGPRVGLRRLILKALEETPAGYETVTLGAAAVPGARAVHRPMLDAFDLEGASVLVIGSGLGELSRLAAERGASPVLGVERDPRLVFLAELINIYNDVPDGAVRFSPAETGLDRACGHVFVSRFPDARPLLPALAAARPRALVVETDPIGDDWEGVYVEDLRRHFAFVVVMGRSDRGGTGPVPGARMILACFTGADDMLAFFRRCQSERPQLSSLSTVDLVQSDIPDFTALLAKGNPDRDTLAAIPDTRPPIEIYGEDAPNYRPEYAYWWEFCRGYLHLQQSGGRLTDANPHLVLVGKMARKGTILDPHLRQRIAGDEGFLRSLVTSRLANFEQEAAPAPALLLDVAGEMPVIALRRNDGEVIVGSRLDGYHRIGAAILSGAPSYPVYRMKVYGALNEAPPQCASFGASMWWLAERDIDAAVAAVPALAGTTPNPLGGRSSLVFEAGSLIYRFADSQWTARQFLKERLILDGLGGEAHVAIPVVERFSTQPVYMAQRVIPGTQVTDEVHARLPAEGKARLVDGMARFLAELHGRDTRPFPFANTYHGDFIIGRFDRYIERFSEMDAADELVAFARETADQLGRFGDEDGPRALLHGDFGLSNCLVDPQTGSLRGVIDFTVSWLGDPHWDFSVVRGGIGDDAFRQLVATYQELGGRSLDISLVMALERTQLCHFLYWIEDGGAAGILDQIRAWRPLAPE